MYLFHISKKQFGQRYTLNPNKAVSLDSISQLGGGGGGQIPPPPPRQWKNYTIRHSCSQKVNRTETNRLKSKPVFNLKPFLGFSSRWSRNIVEDFKNMGKTDHDQHQIDKNHYCSVTFSKIMNECISTTKPLYDWRNKHFGV